MFHKSVLPKLGSKKVADVTFSDCERLHRHLTKDRPIRANRVIEVLRRNFNLALRWGWVDRNPAVGIERNPETKRERYLDTDEISRLLDALDNHKQRTSCDAIKFILFTGCRRGEALNARWDQFDQDLQIWTKPAATTKQRRIHRVPVSSAVSGILKERLSSSNSDYIFESKNGNPITDVKKTWASLLVTAKIENARIHDLRHTFASIAVSQGQSLPIIGAMLGHTQTQTTARYAHLYDDPLIKAAEAVSSSMRLTPPP
ncbi:tyrosine-type recombinase/integrase [Fretibacter rubidus]|uniref:tyrosine-type recombinase/integrase n=1 Tax=Fretibacter rubidus TaxID=570162 RepID=UPI003529EC79